MAIEKGTFASGDLPTVKSPLFVVPSGKTASLRVTLVNTTGGTVICKLYADSRLIDPDGLELQSKHKRSTDYEELSEGHKLEGEASVSGVDFRIKGHLVS